jgi:N6-L-threonylcarbamoyladenine synthase
VRILGIETSCDETAAAVVEDGRRLLANVVASQAALHARYGGIVPEVASRRHLETALPVIETALAAARCSWPQLDAVAVTVGPGLAGSLLIGLGVAKAIAYARDLPLLAVNHLEGHVYANWLAQAGPDGEDVRQDEPRLPALCLIVSGGHTDIVVMADHGRYRRLGQTVDDAAGEAFDKVARLLGLGFPGGPAIEQVARRKRGPATLTLPRARLKRPYDFSFSGLKTKVSRLVRGEEGEPPPPAELAAAFQESVVDSLVTKALEAAANNSAREIILSGGVAANSELRRVLAERSPIPVVVPPPALCTDNGAMIAACAHYRLAASDVATLNLDIDPALKIG